MGLKGGDHEELWLPYLGGVCWCGASQLGIPATGGGPPLKLACYECGSWAEDFDYSVTFQKCIGQTGKKK